MSEEYSSNTSDAKKVSSLDTADEKKVDKEDKIIEKPVAGVKSMEPYYKIQNPYLTREESKIGGIRGRTSALSPSNLGIKTDRFEDIQGRTSVLSAINLGIKSGSRSQTDSETDRSDLTWDIVHKSGRDWTTSANSEPPVTDSTDSSCTGSSGSSNSCLSSQGSRSKEWKDKLKNNETIDEKKVSSLKSTDEKKLDKEDMTIERPVAEVKSMKPFCNIKSPCLTMEESKIGGTQGRTSALSASNLDIKSYPFKGMKGRTSVLSAVNLGIKSGSRSQTDSETERSDLTWDIIQKSGRDWTTSGHSEPTVTDSTDSSCTESSGSSNSCSSSEGSRSEEYQDKLKNNETKDEKKVSSLKSTDEKKLDKEDMIVERPIAAVKPKKPFYNNKSPCLTTKESKIGGI